MIIFSGWQFIFFKSYFLRWVIRPFPTYFLLHSAEINSSPSSSHFEHHNKNSNWFFTYFQSFKERNIMFSGWQFIFFKSYFLRRVTPYFNHFHFHSAGINSFPDSSHFIRHHADDYLWRERPKKKIATFCGPHPWQTEFLSTSWGVSKVCSLIWLLQRLSDVF